MLNVEKFLFETTYTHVNAMVMYRPHWMPPRDPAEVQFWQERLRDCTIAAKESGKVWQRLADTGPTLGPLLECVETRLAAAGRHHKGLLAFYQQQPLPLRYLPAFNEGLEPGS